MLVKFSSSEQIDSQVRDGVGLFRQPNIHIRCELFVPFLRNMFKFLGHSQYLEMCYFMIIILSCCDQRLRFACGFN